MNSRFLLANKIFENFKIPKKNLKFTYKGEKGYLNEIDLIIDNLFKKIISKKYPDDIILSEEQEETDSIFKSNKYTWIIDPVCGTTNFTHSIPFYSSAVSLKKNEETIFSIVKDLNNEDLYYSIYGKSYLNKKRIFVSETKKLKESIVFVNCNQSDIININKNFIKLINALKPPVTRRLHIMESANLELSYVACGKVDAYINFQDNIWDIVAGQLLIKNAGGKVRFINKKNSINNIGILGSNKNLFSKINNIINDII